MCHCAALRGKDGMMTDRYVLDKSVRTNDAVRASYNELTAKTFGFTFEEWYRQGFWTDKNVPYALRDGTKVISNVSVNPWIPVEWGNAEVCAAGDCHDGSGIPGQRAGAYSDQ